MNPLVLLGDSHAAIYARAIREMGAPVLGGPLGGANFFTDGIAAPGPGGLAFTGEAALRFERFAARARIGSLADCRGRLVISLGLAAARFYGSQDWRRADYGPDADAAKQHLSEAVLDAIIAHLQAPVLDFVGHCIDEGLLVAALAGPPPQARHRAVLALGAPRVLDLATRYEKPMRDLLAARAIPIITPPGLTNAEGLLLERYWGDDQAHGNTAFGSLVITELLRVTGRGGSFLPNDPPVPIGRKKARRLAAEARLPAQG